MRFRLNRSIIFGVLLFTTTLAPTLAELLEKQLEASPPWEKELVIWPRYEGESTPWRDDSRISALAPEGYPDDFPVYFDNPDPSVQDEIMWVTAIDYFLSSDEYLGILLNAPNNLASVRKSDNVVFQYDPEAKRLTALMTDGTYSDKGVPSQAREGHALFDLWRGIRQYRLGNFGHNQAAIEQCVSILSSVTQQLGDIASAYDRYLAYFVLGRCNAEAYNTDAAIQAFRLALKYREDDVDAHMALLAEYSLMVHPPVDQTAEEYDASYEPLFLEKLRYVRQQFFDDPAVAVAVTIIFDESEVVDLSKMTPEEISRSRQFGFGVFRWKRR